MGIITKISCQKRNKNRINICIDDEFKGVLFDEIVIKNSLKVGQSLSMQDFFDLELLSQKHFAKQDLFKMLEKTFKTEYEYRKKLYDKGYNKISIDYAIEIGKKYKYINDEQYVKSYIATYENSKSKKAIRYNLKAKGIKFEIDNEEFSENSDLKVVEELVQKFLRTKQVEDNTLNFKDMQKLKRQLFSKGFDYDAINNATSHIEVIYDKN